MPFNQFEKLSFRGYKSQKIFHPSIGWLGGYVMNLKQYYLPKNNIKLLTNLSSLNLAGCYNLKRLPEQLGDMKGLKMIDARNTAIEQLPDSIGHLKALSSLNLNYCWKLRKLPEQFGNMEGLERFDASCSGIKELPDSTGQLIKLTDLNLRYCKRLTSLPEQLGDMKGLKMIDASHTAIEQLPDSIGQLKALRRLDLSFCKKLRKLPEQFGNMEGLKKFDASWSGIEELPDSTGQLINLTNLQLSCCRLLASLPDSIWKLKLLKELDLDACWKLERLPEQLGKMQSLQVLHLPQENMFISNISNLLENHTKNIECLSLACDITSWLPTLQNFSSLRELNLCDEGKSLSSTNCLSLSKLSNLESLELKNWGSSFLELPLNLRHLRLISNATVEQLPDLSNLEHLQTLYIMDCISLQSHPPLPLNLERIEVDRCTSLKDVPDLAILKKLHWLRILHCSSLKSIGLKQSSLQVQPPDSYPSSFSAQLPNRKIAEWFDYKNKGSTVSLHIPSSVLGDDFLGIALWIVYKSKYPRNYVYIRAVITNKTEGIKNNYDFHLERVGDEVQSMVQCISRHEISVKSGDKIKVSFQKSLYRSNYGEKIPGEELKVENCGAHVILKDTSTP